MIIKDRFLNDLILLEPNIFSDKRGFFFESYNKKKLEYLLEKNVEFVQDNHSKSIKGTLRGLHFQTKNEQDKLVRVIKGKIFDVAVDMRKSSKNYGKWIGIEISDENKLQFWIPKGYAHGFFVLSDIAEVNYKTTDYYNPDFEKTIIWNDKTLNIKWPIHDKQTIRISKKDSQAMSFNSF